MGKSYSFDRRELKDSILIEEVMAKAELEAQKTPKLEVVTTEAGYNIVRAESDGNRVLERKVHKPGHFLNPEE